MPSTCSSAISLKLIEYWNVSVKHVWQKSQKQTKRYYRKLRILNKLVTFYRLMRQQIFYLTLKLFSSNIVEAFPNSRKKALKEHILITDKFGLKSNKLFLNGQIPLKVQSVGILIFAFV